MFVRCGAAVLVAPEILMLHIFALGRESRPWLRAHHLHVQAHGLRLFGGCERTNRTLGDRPAHARQWANAARRGTRRVTAFIAATSCYRASRRRSSRPIATRC